MGQLRGGDLRNQHYGSSLLDELLVQGDLNRTYGDKVVMSRPRTVDGEPVGNRQERRLARRMLRRLK
jgi:hypothetical protein